MPRALSAAADAAPATQQWVWACEEQEEFFTYGPYPILASGGFNSAKTTAAIVKLLYLADLYPGYRAVIARRFYSELKQTTMQTFLKLCPPESYSGGTRSEGGGLGVITLNNGSRFTFMHLDRPDAVSVIRGLEVNAALLDQAEEMQEEVYDMLEARLGRWDKATVPEAVVRARQKITGEEWPFRTEDGRLMPPSHMLLTCNPDLEDHWLWRRFHPDSDEWRERWSKRGYKMVTFDTLKNKFASKENVEILMSKEESFRARFVHGKWGNAEGVIFHLDPLSILAPTPDLLQYIRTACRLYRVLDHGDSGVTCCLWCAVDGDGNVFFYREYYMADASVRDHRDSIYELSKEDFADGSEPHYSANFADPAIFIKVARRVGGRDVVNRWAVADEYADAKNYPRQTAIHWMPADNAEMASRERVGDYLRVDPLRMHPIKRERGSPRTFFVKRTKDYPHGCLHAPVEVRSARRVQIGSVNGKPVFGDERDERFPDHALDCVRYMIMSRPAAPRPKEKVYGRLTWEGYARLAREHRRMREVHRGSWQ